MDAVQEKTIGQARFRYEADLVAQLEPQLPSLLYAAGSLPNVETFAEVPARQGVPDLAAVRFDPTAVSRRNAAMVRPLTSDTEVRAVLALGEHRATFPELAGRLKMTIDYVRRALVPVLVEQGWAVVDRHNVCRTPDSVFVGRRVVTVEAKLRDWHGALGQARRQQQSADDAYVAYESATVSRLGTNVAVIAASGVGVISVDPATGRATVVARPSRRLPARATLVGRTLIAERCLEMMTRGEHTGQIYPVFGWTLPTS